MKNNLYTAVLLILLSVSNVFSQNGNLITSEAQLQEMKLALKSDNLFHSAVNDAIEEVAPYLKSGLDVPVPKDLAGGYTHSQHKLNYTIMQKAGMLYQLTGNEQYAELIKNTLLKYAELFPTFDRHPATRSYSPGKFFWQCLNDANWLVYTSQAYSSIYEWLDAGTRDKLNKELFRPYADFLSVQTPQFFNRLHNHSTWANAAVGMIGLVIHDEDLIQKSLYGLPFENLYAKDNDGGDIIRADQKKAGFLANIDHAFSPDGYYFEGPYYQRYAMYPFLMYAVALDRNKKELDIFNYDNKILLKGIETLVQLSNEKGEFFPLNDAQKGMSYYSRELKLAISIAYEHGDVHRNGLLSIVKELNAVPLNYGGFLESNAIAQGKATTYQKRSLLVTDGNKGDKGAIGILRGSRQEYIMKFTQHGMGHGHFDRLSYLMYNKGDEVLQDYGAARYVNINQKDGGGYLKENKTWAKQTVAHNTLVIGDRTQCNAKVEKAESATPELYYFNAEDENVQIMSAKDSIAYDGVHQQRTLVLIKDNAFENPLLLDLFRADLPSDQKLRMPYNYKGQMMYSTFDNQPLNSLPVMGKKDGFQYLWKVGEAPSKGDFNQVNWFNNKVFYTLNMATSAEDSINFVLLGANDPKMNLRNDKAFHWLKTGKKGSNLYASVLETHGGYSYITELAPHTYSSIKNVNVVYNTNAYSAVTFENKEGKKWRFIMCNNDSSSSSKHKLKIGETTLKWKGVYLLEEI
ncbi:alginate lyase family protein [Flammeovirga sp. MY04]|uniref:heparinase II/III domain-containing protein n=1 Tax=Flammeovirga sp. MY04 TaxID=1191459 RepID=UPI0008261E1F|nr:heparinase II/III family protein [Flammeovirga sp. MY04]ANQ49918.2 alginate lyase family protein [Flammeovirga sp. MY04]